MYRIEVAPGEETVFRTIEELAVGIRNGVITPRSRIFHNASQKWLPIGLHPHYKKAMELPAASAAHPTPATPVPAMPRIKPLGESGERRAVQAPPAPKPPTQHAAPAPAEPAPKVPSPVTSPVVAMQREVLKDLPVVEIPEPLPWSPPPAAPSVHAPATHVHTPRVHAPDPVAAPAPIARIATAAQSQPTARVTYAPLVFAEPEVESPAHAPAPAHGHGHDHAHEHHHVEHEEHHHARPTARRAPRAGGRPLMLVGVAAGLVIATHFGLTAMRSGAAGAGAAETEQSDAVSAPAEIQSDMVPSGTEDLTPTPAPTVAAGDPGDRVSSASARVPMVPGPAFAGSAPVRPGDSARVAASAPAPTPPPASGQAPAPAIAPAPVEIELALPDLPPDSVLPVTRSGDTLAMKKILRALNGSKPAEPPAAP